MTTSTKLPATPAHVAGLVLDAIEAHPGAFYMGDWAYLAKSASLAPDADLPCGTTLCAAGWTAHLTGWAIVVLAEDDPLVEVQAIFANSGENARWASRYAEKNGERRQISEVAAVALGLDAATSLWYMDESSAITRLREIAGR